MQIRPITYVLIAGVGIAGLIQMLGMNGMIGFEYLIGATFIALGLLAVYEVMHTNWKFSISTSLKDLSSLSPEGAEHLKSVASQEVALAILFVPTFLVGDRIIKRAVPLQEADPRNPYLLAVLAALAIFGLMRAIRHIRL